MRSIVTAGLILSCLVLSANAVEKRNKTSTGKTQYSKYASPGKSKNDRTRGSGGFAPLSSASAHQKAINSQLQKLESSSNRMQVASQKPTKTRAVRRPMKSEGSNKGAMNFPSKPPKTRMAANSKGRSSVHSSRHSGMRGMH